MVVVAIAGASRGMGKTILEQLQLAGKHQIYVLSRKNSSVQPIDDVKHVRCDYGDIGSLVEVLEENKIDTVISTINVERVGGCESQLNLIAAADQSKTTRRFIPSDFVSVIDEDDPNFENETGADFQSARALMKSQLEYTHFANGIFMDYWGMPPVQSNLDPFKWGIDMVGRKAVVPGTGSDVFSTTYSVDVARFLVRSLDLEKWSKSSVVCGSDITFNDVIALAEKITGAKFHVVHDSLEKLEKNDVTLVSDEPVPGVPEEISKAMMAQVGSLIIKGTYYLPTEGRLNDVFPDIHPTSLEEMLRKAWEGNE